MIYMQIKFENEPGNYLDFLVSPLDDPLCVSFSNQIVSVRLVIRLGFLHYQKLFGGFHHSCYHNTLLGFILVAIIIKLYFTYYHTLQQSSHLMYFHIIYTISLWVFQSYYYWSTTNLQITLFALFAIYTCVGVSLSVTFYKSFCNKVINNFSFFTFFSFQHC